MSSVFRFCGLFIKTDENMVLFVSFMGLGFNDSPKVIYDYIRSHPEYSSYNLIWAFEHPEAYKDTNTVKIDTFAYFKTALKAKYWITNNNIERGLKFKKRSQVYLNTWHGIAIKHIGNDCPGRKDFNFKTVDYLVVSGTHDENVFKSAFNADESSFLRCGMPRNEVLWFASEDTTTAIRKKLVLPSDKKIILYAPTWRESVDGGKSYVIKPPIDFGVWKKTLGDEYIVLFRAHHQTTKVLGVEFDDFIRDYSDYPDVNELMIVSDILITDYSSIAFDYSILCKPIFCFAYDYDTYLSDRGTYFNIDDFFPNKSCRDEADLMSQILNSDYSSQCAKTKLFRDKFVNYGIDSTAVCVKACFGSEGI